MSRETVTDLNTQTLIGYTDKRGHAWHYRAASQGAESNHYAGPIPVEDVRRRLFDWEAISGELRGVALTDDGVIETTDTTRQVIMRSDTGAILGVFKQGYQVHRYQDWLISNVESILDADLAIGSAGLLRGGAVAWVQVEMEDTMNASGVDFRPFLTATTSLDGSLATTYLTGAQVVVCDNTLSCAIGHADERIRVKHSRNSLGRLADVREALGIVAGVADAFSAQVAQLLDESVDAGRWERFVRAYAGLNAELSKRAKSAADAKASSLQRLWDNDERVAPWAGTAYGVVAAVNTYAHHESIVRGADRATRNMERVVTGKVDELDNATVKLLARV